MIKLEGVTKRFGRKVAVESLSFSVNEGEIFGLLGPNGAGKTTTLRLITGLLFPDAGTVEVCGVPLETGKERVKYMLGYVPDGPYVYDKLTGREFLFFSGRVRGLSEPECSDRMEYFVDFFEMDDYIDEMVEGYSHGMKQRLVISSALLHDPPVIVMDEPLAGLDPITARRVKDMLRERTRRGATVLLSTHLISLVEETADRVGVLSGGRLVAEGETGDIRKGASLEEEFIRLTGRGGSDQDA